MTPERFAQITGSYADLRVAVLGDFCLDRYLEIDPARSETSIETGRPVHNVTRVRSQAGGAGTIVNNLSALGVGRIVPLGFRGNDAEGTELAAALEARPGVSLEHFLTTPDRRTFTYCKPLLMHPNAAPEELDRLDFKNWSRTPDTVAGAVAHAVRQVGGEVDALVILDQVDQPDTGVITRLVLEAVGEVRARNSEAVMLADSRRGFENWPPVSLKMNGTEFARAHGEEILPGGAVPAGAGAVARRFGRVFVTLSEGGILGLDSRGANVHEPSLPLRGEIDVVGAGDAVTANLACALAAGADLSEAVHLANTAASVVIHQLGTTGTADIAELEALAC